MFRYVVQHKLMAVFFVFLLVGSASSAVYFIYRGQKRIQHLYVPKVLMVRVDEIPFPKNSRNSIDVMAGSPVTITCETIRPLPEKGLPGFRFIVAGRTYDTPGCKLNVSIPGEIGSTQQISLDYLLKKPDGSTEVIDRYDAMVHLTPGGEYFRIHAFGSPDGKPLTNLTVPWEVIPYVDVAAKIYGDPQSYVVLFFVEAYGSDLPVLQVKGHARSRLQLEAISAPLERYRGFGRKLSGYAAWPANPIHIGGPGDKRMVFEVFAGIFEAEKIKSIVDKLLAYDEISEDGQVQVRVNPVRRTDIKALAWQGLLSDPIRVVRAAESSPGQSGKTGHR